MQPEFFDKAPFVAAPIAIEPAWIDYNDHLNMAYYNVLFDRSGDELCDAIGIGRAYLEETGHSIFTVEAHLRYLREVKLDDPMHVHIWLIGFDAKRMQVFKELRHVRDGWLSATSETMYVHVDMAARKSSPFRTEALERMARIKTAHDRLPQPEGIGRRVAMPGK
jgi:acyl-CoA thioester hydrolase